MDPLTNFEVAALYVRTDTVYKKFAEVDCWDINRDATQYPGKLPVICHPPCRSWGNFDWKAKPREGEKQLAVIALQQVRLHGGILEHPRTSKLWKLFNLPTGQRIDEYGGFSISISQNWFGHKAHKRTLLYIVGTSPKLIPPFPLRFDAITHCVSDSPRPGGKRLKEISKSDRERTPERFAAWLIELAKICKK